MKPLNRSIKNQLLGSINGSQDFSTIKAGEKELDTALSVRARGEEAVQQFPESAPECRRVLLVEDNRVNQQVGQAMLERLGCAVTLAGHGLEALAALERESFDLILMDCQMPELDGYQATRRIRELEQREGSGRRIPIVALTAHAMEENRLQCLAAGMDDHLCKPMSRAQLKEVLQRWLPEAPLSPLPPGVSPSPLPSPTKGEGVLLSPGGAAQEGAAGGADAEQEKQAERPPVLEEKVLDAIRALQREGGVNLLDKVIGRYLTDAPGAVTEIGRSIEAGDAAALTAAAHAFKSSSANVGALFLSGLCAKLEQMGRCGELGGAPELLLSLEEECAAVCSALSQNLSTDGPTN